MRFFRALNRFRAPMIAVTACAIGLTAITAIVGGSCGRPKTVSGKSSASPSPGQCNNPYFPVADDLKLEYQSDFSGGLPGYSFTVTFTDVTNSSFVRREESSTGVTVDGEWKCRPDGLIAGDFNDMAAPQPRLKLTASKSTGVVIPSLAKWERGSKWSYNSDVSGEMMFGGAPKPVEVSGTVSVTSEVTGQEPLTVPGGTFDALKVTSRTVERLSMKGGQSLPGDIVFSTTAWYAKDAGLVKVQSADLKVTTVLTSLSRQQPAPEDENGSSAAFRSVPEPGIYRTHCAQVAIEPAVLRLVQLLVCDGRAGGYNHERR